MTRPTWAASLGLLIAAGVAAGCHTDPVQPSTARADPVIGLEIAGAGPGPHGDRVVVTIVVETGAAHRLAGLLGDLRFDPDVLRYLGQPGAVGPFAIINAAGAGQGLLRIASLAVEGLPRRTATLVFEVTTPGRTGRLRYSAHEAVGVGLERVAATVGPAPSPGSLGDDLRNVRQLTLADWAAILPAPGTPRTPLVAGDGLIFGDATLDQVISMVDAFGAANVAVGNFGLITSTTKDYVVAANVAPFNLPGLGEASDPAPPGLEPDGSRLVTILDAAAIANEAVGNDQPIVGEAIPGRAVIVNRVTVTGPITESRTFTPDTIYELQGVVTVDAGATLTILAGTRIEGDPVTNGRLVVARGANIVAQGTLFEPIVFTCAGPAKAPGCWGGVVINGLSLLNNSQTGPGSIPGCPERQSIGNLQRYGGCLIADNSGVLEYVRIEYAGRLLSQGIRPPGLALLGVGTGTTINHLQIHGSAAEGMLVSGGTAQFRFGFLTANQAAGIRWDDGWQGKAQFVIIQQESHGGPALLGSNWGVQPDAGPRSSPAFYNTTLIGASGGPGPGQGIRLIAGSGLTFRNGVVLGFGGSGLDIDDDPTCVLAAGPGALIVADTSFFHQNTPNFDLDLDCLDEAAYALAPTRANQLVDPQLVSPFATRSPDVRPTGVSPAGAGGATPPADAFFDPTATWFGAVKSAGATGAQIPWFTGWTRGWSGVP